jgi:aryl-alcohol dehydrogenase-like predicted oxidoreductase
VQATWNLLEPSAGDALVRAHAAGVGVLVKEALANGRLTGRAEAYDEPAAHGEAVRATAREAQELGVTIDALAIAVVLAQPWADCVLSGAVRVEQLESNLKALDVDMPADVLARLRRLAMPPTKYWAHRAASPWT